MKLNLFAKQIGSFSIFVAILIGFGVFSLLFQMSNLHNQTQYITQNTIPSLQTINKLSNTITDYRREQLQHVIASSTDDMKSYEEKIAEDASQVDALFEAYQQVVSDPDDQQ
jgi:methyl-accepting chemotaxis protein